MTTDMSTSDTIVSLVRDPFLNTDEACGYLGVPKATLLTWRVRRPGYGPRAVKAGGRLKYRLSELDRWLDAHEDSFTQEQIDSVINSQALRRQTTPRDIANAVLWLSSDTAARQVTGQVLAVGGGSSMP